ncbi:MAG: hypothetical protein A3G59_03560 [Candidatus Taylorbacteria bacterium RIFCSPLOWO2_12_FULL_47_20]|uniref:TraD/TraG TraM recognition site domain-containing protein n=2 Tax=Candidatus Tayloriibacteriota TaxID=1817919 RepID=A0A1G2P561_9BACT|nr:MAG: hypothetical protein A3H68_03485 [Candidatus Taylorbacteria bacterium RIFCSPLOWO2_02_FULL_46_40]OHA43466.1 MAG: hypothetical protein A3G59_03560 [Candidatus Taylorbacteria bacterium RIFCSPLOWO2_12_FULL_47_20]
MDKGFGGKEVGPFGSPASELQYLRSEVERLKNEKESVAGREADRNESYEQKIKEYKETPPTVLKEGYRLEDDEVRFAAIGLRPEPHDKQMAELIGIFREKGIKNALSVLAAMNNPHLDDDFERFLVAFIKASTETGLRKSLAKSLRMTLYEITLPTTQETKDKTLKELLSSMEQFYAGMTSIKNEKEKGPKHMTLEIAVANHSEEFVFYCAVPDGKRELFEKQIASIFPKAIFVERKDDYNIFNETGEHVCSVAAQRFPSAYPLKTYDEFDYDPLNVILNSFAKIDREGEGAAVQIVFRPEEGTSYKSKYEHSLKLLREGKTAKDAVDREESGEVVKFARDVFQDWFRGDSKKKEEEKQESKTVDEEAVKSIEKKLASPSIFVELRLVVSSRTRPEAEDILSDMESAFNQFENQPKGNSFRFIRKSGSGLKKILHNFSYRLCGGDTVALNLRELTSIFHFPGSTISQTPELKVAKAGEAPVPLGMPTDGILLGMGIGRSSRVEVYMNKEDRLRHLYVIGQTGTGKTTFLKNLIVQDIKNGEGVCFIDPHGNDIEDIIGSIPPSRYDDLIYFDPGNVARPMGLNMLEYDPRFPEQKTFVVNEMLSIFNKLFDMKTVGGPMFEQYFRNAAMLLLDDPTTGCTLVDLSRILSDKQFRAAKLAACRNPIVLQFWREVAEKAGGEAALQNVVPYITSKFDGFLSNDIMRPIVAQEKSVFDFRGIMDNRKILLVNLSKGRLGDINSNLLGLIIVGKFLMAALSRAGEGQNAPPFYLYIDEFQNVTTDSIAVILSEARKYKLALIMAHQYIKQLEEKIKDAVFGNVGSMAAFRVGAEDAEVLEKQFVPNIKKEDLINLENRAAYMRMLAQGKPVLPFSLSTIAPEKRNDEILERLKQLSYLKFGRDREEVEREILARYETKKTMTSIGG